MQINKIDFLVKTLERYDALDNFLKSVLKYYPEAKVSIADDSEKINEEFYDEWKKYLDVHLYKMTYDSGLSAGRNLLVEKTDRPYIFLLDDDFEFTKDTDLSKLKTVVDSSDDIMIAGGMCLKGGTKEEHYEFDIKFENRVLEKVPISMEYETIKGIKAYKTDSVLNFALMKRELFDTVKWNNELKIIEHLNFYLKLFLSPYRCVYVPEVKINHMKRTNQKYSKLRVKRNREFLKKSMIYSGIVKIIEPEIIYKIENLNLVTEQKQKINF